MDLAVRKVCVIVKLVAFVSEKSSADYTPSL